MIVTAAYTPSDPHRLCTSGLTSRRWQSGTSIDIQGRISKAGDADVRRALYEAASGLMTRFKGKDKVKTWGQQLAKRSCHRKPPVKAPL